MRPYPQFNGLSLTEYRGLWDVDSQASVNSSIVVSVPVYDPCLVVVHYITAEWASVVM